MACHKRAILTADIGFIEPDIGVNDYWSVTWMNNLPWIEGAYSGLIIMEILVN